MNQLKILKNVQNRLLYKKSHYYECKKFLFQQKDIKLVFKYFYLFNLRKKSTKNSVMQSMCFMKSQITISCCYKKRFS